VEEIRKLSEDELRLLSDIQANAYPAFKVNSEEEREKMAQRFIKISQEEPTTHFYGMFLDNVLVGGMRLFDFKMRFLSTKIKTGGVGMVGVDLYHKKQKVCKSMITYFLEHYKNSGAPMAALYPFRPDFYKKMGFGFGTKMNQYKIKPQNLPSKGSQMQAAPLAQEDKELLLECYNKYVDKTHGIL